jgi:hypothetical protein
VDLPPLAAVAAEIALAVDGQVLEVPGVMFPSYLVTVGGRCHLLLRELRANHTYLLALPRDRSWQFYEPEGWAQVKADVVSAVTAYVPDVLMLDVIARVFFRLTVECPIEPVVPEEARIFRGNDTATLTQTPTAVTVTVWTDTKQERVLTTLDATKDLAPWVVETWALRAQILGGLAAKLDEDLAREAALPVPALDEVLDALRAGHEYLVGGRTSTSYAVRDGQLTQIDFDEGHTEEHPCSEDGLRAAIASQPKSFREWLAACKSRGETPAETPARKP